MKNESVKKKKSLKGMTLVEIIISLAIVSVMTVVLVATSSAINNFIKSARNVNNTVATQVPVAETKDISNAHKIQGIDDEGNVVDYVAEITFGVKGNTTGGSSVDKSVTMQAQLYEAEDPSNIDDDQLGGALNMKFLEDIQYKSST